MGVKYKNERLCSSSVTAAAAPFLSVSPFNLRKVSGPVLPYSAQHFPQFAHMLYIFYNFIKLILIKTQGDYYNPKAPMHSDTFASKSQAVIELLSLSLFSECTLDRFTLKRVFQDYLYTCNTHMLDIFLYMLYIFCNFIKLI